MQSKTYLQLVNETRTEAMLTAPALGSFAAPSAESARFILWVRSAWNAIQALNSQWSFLLKDFQFNTTANVGSYAATDPAVALADFGDWKRDSLRCYLTATGVSNEQVIGYRDFEVFRDMYLYSASRNTRSRPVLFSVDPTQALRLGPVPDNVYTINGQYYATPTELVGETDTPNVQPQFHDIVKWRALMTYGEAEAAPEVLRRATREYSALLQSMQSRYLPVIEMGAPLA